jgi:dTDP-4-amino-4,6-dideoxygalactose transaminase
MTEQPTVIPHSKPLLGIEEAQAVAAVIASGRLAEGPETAAFERELAGRLGCGHAVAVSSGTAALHLALAALGVGAGDEVIVPSFVCAALFHAVAATGAVPVPADIDPATLNLDPADARRRLTPRTAALVLPHLFGRVADSAPFLALGVPLVEDCAHALGGGLAGRPAGSLGRAAITSSYATKLIATGEGGAVATSSAALAAAVRELKQYDRRPLDRTRHNFKFTDLQAAVGRVQLRRLEAFILRRREIAACYRSALGPPLGGDTDPDGRIYFRYVVDAGPDAEALIRRAAIAGVTCERPVHTPLHRLMGRAGFPATEDVWRRAVSIPIYPALTDPEVEHIVSTLKDVR